jgi:putative MATE family efflux protein
MDADRSRLPLLQLAWPILVENLLRTSLLSVDTVMLGRFSPKAVAAMSLVNQFAFFIQLLYMVVATGASILIAQNLGAGRRREAGLIGVGSLALILSVSLVVSAVFALFTGPLVGLYRLEPEVARYSVQFLGLYGGLSFFMAFNVGQATILRAWGHVRDPMLVNVLGLFLTVGGNALCLFGPFGFPVLGVLGVAASTVFSQVVSCGLFFVLLRRRRDVELPLGLVRRIPRRVYRAMLAVGVPTAGENLAYNLSQIATLAMLSQLGTTSLAAYGILLAVLRYVFMPGVSIGMGAQIKVGYLVGAGRHDLARGKVYRYFAVAFGISVVGVVLVQWWHRALLGLFTDDPDVIGLASSVLLVALVHEPGRNFNTVIIPALKGAGDVRFPVLVGMVSMWGVGVFGAWLLGVRLGLGLPGVWAAMAADEWLRGLLMLWRWRSGAWTSKALLGAQEAEVALSAVEIAEGL